MNTQTATADRLTSRVTASPRVSRLAALILAAAVTIATAAPWTNAAWAQSSPAAAAVSESTIKALQEALNKQGVAVPVDGALNDRTRAAIRQYQSQHHLPVTGEPDAATLAKLGVPGRQSATQPPQTAAQAAPGAQSSGRLAMPGQMQATTPQQMPMQGPGQMQGGTTMGEPMMGSPMMMGGMMQMMQGMMQMMQGQMQPGSPQAGPPGGGRMMNCPMMQQPAQGPTAGQMQGMMQMMRGMMSMMQGQMRPGGMMSPTR